MHIFKFILNKFSASVFYFKWICKVGYALKWPEDCLYNSSYFTDIKLPLERNRWATSTLLTNTSLESNMTHFTCHSSAVTAGRQAINLLESRWHDWLLTVCTSFWRKVPIQLWLNVTKFRWYNWLTTTVKLGSYSISTNHQFTRGTVSGKWLQFWGQSSSELFLYYLCFSATGSWFLCFSS